MKQPASESEENRRLRRTMRDLVALSTLPAVWIGRSPEQIARSLADVLLNTLSLDLIYVRLTGRSRDRAIEAVRGKKSPDPRGIERIRAAIAPLVESDQTEPSVAITDPIGGGVLHVTVTRFGGHEHQGVLVTGSSEPEFPSEQDRALLGVAANQMAIILQRRRAEEELAQNEQELADFFDNATIGLHWVGPNGIILRANQAELDMLGYAREEYVGQPIDRFHVDQDVICDILSRLKAGQRLEEYPARLRCKDGSIKDVLIDSSVLWRDGKFIHTRCFTRDVTERYRAELALRDSEERFRQLAENIEGVFWMADARNPQVLFVSPAYERIWGRSRLSLYQQPHSFLDAVHPNDRQRVAGTLERQARGENTAEEYRIIHPDGTERWVLDRAFPILDADGRVYRVAGIAEDITERRRAEQELKLQARVLESMAEGVSLSDENGIIVYTNPAEDRIFGYERGELIGQHVRVQNTYPPEENRRIVSEVMERLKTEGAWSGEFSNRKKDGSVFTTFARITVLEIAGRQYFVCVQEDITDRKRVEKALQDARSRLEAALEAGAIVTWTWDIPNNRLHADEKLARLFGLDASDARGGLLTRYIQSIHPEDQPRVSAALDRSIESGHDYEADYRIVQRDGSLRWVAARGRVDRDETGRPIRMPGVLVDITERKQAEEQLRRSERVSRFLAEATTALATLADYNNTLRRVAELSVPFFADWCIVEMAGDDRDLRALAIAHADQEKVRLLEQLRQRYPSRAGDAYGPQNVLRTGQPEMMTEISQAAFERVARDAEHLRLLKKLGFRSYISVPLKARGRTLGVLTFATAESDRTYTADDVRLAEDLAHRAALAVDNAALYTTAQDALLQKEQSLALLDTLQQNAPVGFAFVDRQFRYVRINEALAAIDGNTPGSHVGRTVQETVPMLWPKLEPLYRRVLETGQPVMNQEVTGETPAAPGQARHWLVNYYPVRVHGEVVGIGVLVADITERKRLEDELRQQAAQLKEADRRKDEFLATLAHELRNPLAPIRNALQILKMPRVDSSLVQQTRDIMERQVHHLVRLVDDLLDVSRVMRGKIELRKEPVELATIVARAIETAKPLIEVQGHQLTISMPPDSLLLNADPVRLAQVIGNLVTNSAKYSEANGHIRVTAWRRDNEAVLSVRDDGIGIAPDMLPHIFDLFVQADHSSTKAQGGLGIGLTLVKNLVEMHNGTVKAQSDGLGKGSEFIVSLPLVQEQPPPPETANLLSQHETPQSGHRLLVVDDNKDAATSLAMLLRLEGHHVQIAHDGATAIEVARSLRPALVFLDIGMPGMDGYAVARVLRQTPGLERIVLAALTGWGQQEDRRRTAEAGFDHHLVKPPDPKILEGLLSELNGGKRDSAVEL